jgi:large subunit ribosomal protein L3
MAQDPGRVFPGKKMPGHMGAVKRTAQSLQIVRIDEARQLLLIRGAVPGSRGGDVIVVPSKRAKKPAVKAKAAPAADAKK